MAACAVDASAVICMSGHGHAHLAIWAWLPPVVLTVPGLLYHQHCHCHGHCHTRSMEPVLSAPPMRSLHLKDARILASRTWDRCRRPLSARLAGTLKTWSSYANTRWEKEATKDHEQVRRQPTAFAMPTIPAARTELKKYLARWVAAETGYQWQNACRLRRVASVVHLLLATGRGRPWASLGPKRQELQQLFRVGAQLNPRSHASPTGQPVCWCEGAGPSVQEAALRVWREDPGLWAPATLKLIFPPPKHHRRTYIRDTLPLSMHRASSLRRLRLCLAPWPWRVRSSAVRCHSGASIIHHPG